MTHFICWAEMLSVLFILTLFSSDAPALSSQQKYTGEDSK